MEREEVHVHISRTYFLQQVFADIHGSSFQSSFPFLPFLRIFLFKVAGAVQLFWEMFDCIFEFIGKAEMKFENVL